MYRDSEGSGRLYLREGFVDQIVKLRVDAIERRAERERENRIVAGEHGDGGTEHSGLQSREQAGDLSAIRRQEVTMRFRRSEDKTLQP